MNRLLALLLCSIVALTAAAEGERSTAAQARAMLDRAVTAMKADKTKALASFNSGAKEFRDGDLYVFCAGADGMITAHPTMMGQNIKDTKDDSGKAVGQEMLAKAKEGQVASVKYVWPRPGSDKAVPKETFVTKVGDQLCGVGYYPQP